MSSTVASRHTKRVGEVERVGASWVWRIGPDCIRHHQMPAPSGFSLFGECLSGCLHVWCGAGGSLGADGRRITSTRPALQFTLNQPGHTDTYPCLIKAAHISW